MSFGRRRPWLVLLLVAVSLTAATPAGGAEPGLPVEEATQLYKLGYLMTLMGQYDEAISLFRRSLTLRPTAEAFTFLGWTYSHLGDHRRAIEEAEKAIAIDPDFGNPYNDIGVYLIEQGRDDEAIPYLEKAIRAPRYCCYQFPHFNLGRIYVRKKLYARARGAFLKALVIDPDYAPARQALARLRELGVDEI